MFFDLQTSSSMPVMPGIMPLRPQKYMCAPLSIRVKISSEYSSTLSWMYILPPFLFVCSRESA
jgi:hypothetical protein